MRISDWSSDVCSSDLPARRAGRAMGDGHAALPAADVRRRAVADRVRGRRAAGPARRGAVRAYGARAAAPLCAQRIRTAAQLCRGPGLCAPQRAGFSAHVRGYAFLAVGGYAFSVWGPAYFMRLHGLSPAEVGLLFGVGYGGFRSGEPTSEL